MRFHSLRPTYVVSGLALALAMLLLAGCDLPQVKPLVQPGDKVTDFSVVDLQGQPVQIKDVIEGKVALVDVWATWCVPCVQALPHLQALHNRFNDRDFTVVGILTDANAMNIGPEFLEDQPVSYPMLVDEGGEAFISNWGQVAGIPLLVLVDKDGTVVQTIQGTGDLDAIDRSVEELLGVSSTEAVAESTAPSDETEDAMDADAAEPGEDAATTEAGQGA